MNIKAHLENVDNQGLTADARHWFVMRDLKRRNAKLEEQEKSPINQADDEKCECCAVAPAIAGKWNKKQVVQHRHQHGRWGPAVVEFHTKWHKYQQRDPCGQIIERRDRGRKAAVSVYGTQKQDINRIQTGAVQESQRKLYHK